MFLLLVSCFLFLVSRSKNKSATTVAEVQSKVAYCPGKSAVISTFRLKSKDKSLELVRFKKVAIQ